MFSSFQERLELIGKQYEADKVKLEKIRLLLVIIECVMSCLVYQVLQSYELKSPRRETNCRNSIKKLREHSGAL